ncbi:MAG: Gfo/Idh/MocA family oxidoreductase [Armatimonadetes bacterium]|nr:Gfo/Idh/MocA family oxidoreductase [Armatimonadota bacterium]
MELSRREFLKTTGAAVALTGVGITAASADTGASEAKKATPPSEKITVGFIGVGPRGQHLFNEFTRYEDVQVGAVCDVYEPHLQGALAKSGPNAKGYKDYRKLLEQKDLDVVVIASPPQWHPLMSIAACEAGKDVYCEKPTSRYPAEAQAMLKAAVDNKRMTQVGTQIHAGDNFRRCVEIVRSGVLGKISTVKVICNMNEYPGLPRVADSPVPEGLDWDLWTGPSRKIPYNQTRFELHRYFTDYVGSWLHELGPHIVDLAWWAMDPGPLKSVTATGGRYVIQDMSDIPDTMDAIWEFDDFTMMWSNTTCNGYNFGFGGAPDGGRRLSVIFQGTNGTLIGDYGSYQVVADGQVLKDFVAPEPSIPSSPGQQRELLNAVKTRELPLCSFQYHQPMALAFDLAHVAMNSGRKIHWDHKTGQVIGDEKAQKMCFPNYRKPWALPK